MMVLLYILAFIFLLIALVLISPIRLTIDSSSDTYALKWSGIGNARILFKNDVPFIRMKIFAFKKDFNLLNAKNMKDGKKKDKKPKLKKTNKMTFQKLKRMMDTFSIKAFYVNLDSDNYLVNGYLYPISQLLRFQNKSIKINYVGQNKIQLIIENRLYKIIKAYLL